MFVFSLRRWMRCALCALALAVLAEGTFYSLACDTLPEQLLRLHVVANSDSEEDQAVKLQVRDALLALAAVLCEDAADPFEAQSALCTHMEALEEAACSALKKAGHEPNVRLYFTDARFPPCEYAGFTLPAGEYRALRVVIGEGEGHNWWCVLFPGLCLPCGGAVEPAAELTAELTEALTPAQQAVTDPDGITVRWKLVEWVRRFFNG